MTQLLGVLSEYAEAMARDERLSPGERTFVQTCSLAWLASKVGTDLWTMEAAALAEDVALTEQHAAEAKRKAGEAKRNAAEARQLASKAARIASNRRQAPVKKGERRTVGRAKATTRRAA